MYFSEKKTFNIGTVDWLQNMYILDSICHVLCMMEFSQASSGL